MTNKFLLRPQSRKNRRGVVLILVVASLALVMLLAAFSVGRSFLFYRHVQAQQAADFAAISAGWYVSTQLSAGNTTITTAINSAATTNADAIAQKNGYASSTVLVTTDYEGNPDYVNVQITRTEPYFFAAMFGEPQANVIATATADCQPSTPIPASPEWYGRVGTPWVLCAYGPDDGAVRGDAIDAYKMYPVGDTADSLSTDSSATNPQTNPDNSPYGEVYSFTVPGDYEQRNGNDLNIGAGTQKLPNGAAADGNTYIQFEVYDPELYKNNTNTVATAGIPDQVDNNTTGETWNFSLWKGNPALAGSGATEIAWANYNEGNDSNAAAEFEKWVTPNIGFIYDPTADLATAENAAGAVVPVKYYIMVSSVANTAYSSGVGPDPNYGAPGSGALDAPGSGVGTDKNGYMLRAGPYHPELNSATASIGGQTEYISNPLTTQTYTSSGSYPKLANSTYSGTTADNVWEQEYGYAYAMPTITDTSSTYPSMSIANGDTVDPVPAIAASTNITSSKNPVLNVLEPHNGIVMATDAINGMSITCCGLNQGSDDLYLIPLYFGPGPPNPVTANPTIISFYGFDEDSGALDERPPFYEAYYTAIATGTSGEAQALEDVLPPTGPTNVAYVGDIPTTSPYGASGHPNGNGIWSDAGILTPDTPTSTDTPSNTLEFPSGTYQESTWTCYYTTGVNDVVTFKWTGATGDQPQSWLTSTEGSAIY